MPWASAAAASEAAASAARIADLICFMAMTSWSSLGGGRLDGRRQPLEGCGHPPVLDREGPGRAAIERAQQLGRRVADLEPGSPLPEEGPLLVGGRRGEHPERRAGVAGIGAQRVHVFYQRGIVELRHHDQILT